MEYSIYLENIKLNVRTFKNLKVYLKIFHNKIIKISNHFCILTNLE